MEETKVSVEDIMNKAGLGDEDKITLPGLPIDEVEEKPEDLGAVLKWWKSSAMHQSPMTFRELMVEYRSSKDNPAWEFEWTCNEKTFNLDELVFGDFVEDECKINDRLTVKFRSLSGEESTEIEEFVANKLSDLKRPTPKFLGNILTMRTVAYSLSYVNGKRLSRSVDDRYKYITTRDGSLIDLITRAYDEFRSRINWLASDKNLKNS